MDRDPLTIACTLGPDDGRARLLRWQQLHEHAAPAAHLDGGRLEVRYPPGPGVQEELISLAAAERACCSFAEWTVTSVDGKPTLQVTAAPDALGTVAALFGVAPPGPRN